MRAKSANAARSRELAGNPPSSGPAGQSSVFALRAACGGCASTRACGRSPKGEGFEVKNLPRILTDTREIFYILLF